jgi:ketosteroid isomerase-like protein
LITAALRWGYGQFNATGKLPIPVLDPSMEFEQSAALIDTAGTFSGIDGFEAMVTELREAFGQIRFEPESVVWLSQDELLLTIRFLALGMGSGVGAEREIAHLLTLRGGRIVRFTVFWNLSEAAEAVGLTA